MLISAVMPIMSIYRLPWLQRLHSVTPSDALTTFMLGNLPHKYNISFELQGYQWKVELCKLLSGQQAAQGAECAGQSVIEHYAEHDPAQSVLVGYLVFQNNEQSRQMMYNNNYCQFTKKCPQLTYLMLCCWRTASCSKRSCLCLGVSAVLLCCWWTVSYSRHSCLCSGVSAVLLRCWRTVSCSRCSRLCSEVSAVLFCCWRTSFCSRHSCLWSEVSRSRWAVSFPPSTEPYLPLLSRFFGSTLSFPFSPMLKLEFPFSFLSNMIVRYTCTREILHMLIQKPESLFLFLSDVRYTYMYTCMREILHMCC